MIETQPGEARNDIMGLAFLLAFAAFLINGHQRRAPAAGAVQDAPERDAPLLDKGPLIMAGIAAGLAASVKTTFLVPVVAIAIGVVIFSGRGRRWTSAWVMGLPMLVVGGYWYLRAAIKTGGNPIPITKFGPLNLPTPDQMPLDPRPRFAVIDYITNPTIYRRWFFPELENAFGPLWPLILIMAVSRRRLHRLEIAQQDPAGDRRRLAADRGRLRLHAADRGRAGGLADGLLHQHALPGAGAGPGDGDAAAGAAAAGAGPARLADAALPHRGLRDHGADDAALVHQLHRRHDLPHPLPGLGAGGAVAGADAAGASAGRRSPWVAAVLVLLAVVLGRAQQVQYADQHYVNPDPFLGEGGPKEAYVYTQKLQDKQIGIIGSSQIIFGQYGFYGNDATNQVEFIGVKGPHGANRLPTSCPQLRAPDQRRRLRIPGDEPVHAGHRPLQHRRPEPVPVPRLRLGEERPGGEAGGRRQPGLAAARLRVQGRRASSTPAACKPEKRPEVPGEEPIE